MMSIKYLFVCNLAEQTYLSCPRNFREINMPISKIVGDDLPFFCCFCGHQVIIGDDEQREVDPCDHVLFLCTDHGFEFKSQSFDKHLGIKNQDEHSLGEEVFSGNYDELTDQVKIYGSVKFAHYMPNSHLGAYIGFAP
jgi:hypothetical protein